MISSWLSGKSESNAEIASLRYRMAKLDGFDGSYTDFLDLDSNVTFERPDPKINWHNVYRLRNGLGIGIVPKEVDISEKALGVYYHKPFDFHAKFYCELYKLSSGDAKYLDGLSLEFKHSEIFTTSQQFMGYSRELLTMLHSLYLEADNFNLHSLVLVEMAYSYLTSLGGTNDNDLLYHYYLKNG